MTTDPRSRSERPLRSSQEQFGQTAASYTTSNAHRGGESLQVVTDLLSQGGAHFARAVDIATGPGFTAFAASPFSDHVVATDLTPQMLEEVRKVSAQRGVSNVGMMLVAAEAMPFADASLDLVTCRTAPHHFLDVRGWLAEVARTLRPGGVFVVADTSSPEEPELIEWMNDVERRRDPSHVHSLTPSQWASAVEDAGLHVTAVEMCEVKLNYPDWVERANVPEEEAARLGGDLRNAPAAAKEAFGIEAKDDGTIAWSWPVTVIRAVRR